MHIVLADQKNEERIQERGDSQHIHQNELDKSCLQHDMAYADFKDLARRTTSDKILRYKAFNIAKNLKYDACQRGFASRVYKCFDKKTSGSDIKNENSSNK